MASFCGRWVNTSGANLSVTVEPFSEHDYCTKTTDVTMTNAGYRSSHKLLFLDTYTLLSQASYRMSFVSILEKHFIFFLLFSIIEGNCKFKHI